MKTKCSAMSLVEVLAVIAIIAVALSTMTLGLSGVRRFQAERQLHNIVAELNDLRSEAMTSRKEVKLEFGEESYLIDTSRGRERVHYVTGLEFLEAKTANGFPHFAFSPSGRPANSGTAYFRIDSEERTIVLSPVNGAIYLGD